MSVVSAQEVQKEFLSTVHKSQAAVLDMIKVCVDTIEPVTAKLPSPSIPFAARLPKAEDVVARTYDLAEALLAGQRKFAEDVLKAIAPLRGGDGEVEPQAPAA